MTGFSGVAGRLDGAPFHVATNEAWHLDDSVVIPKGKGVSILGVLTNEQAGVSARIVETDFSESPAQSLEDICSGVRKSFRGYPLKITADEATTFLGYPARRFAYENRPAKKAATYNEAVVFVVGKIGWTVSSTGPLGGTNEVRQAFRLFQKPGEAKHSINFAN